MSLDLILKINFFFILFDGIFAFLKNVYREGVKISKNFSWSCWANLLKIFSSSLLRRIFQKWPSPPQKSGQLKSEIFYFYFHHPCSENDFLQKPVLEMGLNLGGKPYREIRVNRRIYCPAKNLGSSNVLLQKWRFLQKMIRLQAAVTFFLFTLWRWSKNEKCSTFIILSHSAIHNVVTCKERPEISFVG